MNSSNAKDFLPLVKALAEGKVIQGLYPNLNGGSEWCDMTGEIAFDAPASNYRIKPEPREIFAIRYPNGDEFFHKSKEGLSYGNGGVELIRYREVIE